MENNPVGAQELYAETWDVPSLWPPKTLPSYWGLRPHLNGALGPTLANWAGQLPEDRLPGNAGR